MIVRAYSHVILNHIPMTPSPVDLTYSFCPGEGTPCGGVIVVNGVETAYGGSKGFNEPDVIITL